MREIAAEWFERPLSDLTTDVSFELREWGIEKPDQYESLHRFAVTQRQLFETSPMIPGARLYLRKLSDEATRLDHLRVDRRGTEDPTDDRPVELEAVGDDQGTCCELHARRDVTNERQGVPVAASPDDSRRPETRPDLNRREHPRRPRLPPGTTDPRDSDLTL